MEYNINKEQQGFISHDSNIKIKHPYGEKDPYAIVELVAMTKIEGDKYSVDQMPALSARVSHASSGKTGENKDRDLKLMSYLAKNLHMTPFEHQSATFKVVTPLIVARQWMRHRTQSYNEVSMRYSADPVGKFYYPQEWRLQAKTNQQSSFGQVDNQQECTKLLKESYEKSLQTYQKLLDIGVCREQARLVIPVGNYTEFYATANLRNWFAFYRLRSAQDAQWEIREYAKSIGDILKEIWPDSWNALLGGLR
ncbi:MAG: FAD-dependent thymidylate synthase [bacterium]